MKLARFFVVILLICSSSLSFADLLAVPYDIKFTKHGEKELSADLRGSIKKLIDSAAAYLVVYEPEGDSVIRWEKNPDPIKDKRLVILPVWSDDPVAKGKKEFFVSTEDKTTTVGLILDEVIFDKEGKLREDSLVLATVALSHAFHGEVYAALSGTKVEKDRGMKETIAWLERMTNDAAWKRIERDPYRSQYIAKLAELKK